MKKRRKFAILVTTTALTLGITSPIGQAMSPKESQNERIAIEVHTNEEKVSKSDFIKKLKTLLPTQFDFLSESDFQISNAHHYPDDDRIRYDLSFHKMINGKDIYGNVTFVGDSLDIESFYYDPITTSDSLFPAKLSKEEAQKVATDFLGKLPNGKNYELEPTNTNSYYYSNQLLTEPIRYDFSFVLKENNIPISDQQIYVTVLGNGDIIQFYSFSQSSNKATFDDAKLAKSYDDILEKVKNNLAINLKYQINYDYKSGKENVALVYQPSINLGVNALTSEWQTANGFTKEVPNEGKVEPLSKTPLSPKYNDITIEEAKKIAQELLIIDSDKVKLNISSVHEYENEYGQPFLSINYSYDWELGGYGSTIDINKQTGEIISYQDLKADVLRELGEANEKGKLNQTEAEAKAIEHLKQWVPSYIHNYGKPITDPYIEEGRGIYNFTFPRIVNGIVVEGSQINVSVQSDGSLYSLYINQREFENWPSTNNVISSDVAKKQFIDALSLKLQYIKQNDPKSFHYNLVYTPIFNNNQSTYLDATTGKWGSMFGESEFPHVTHPNAENELNYLIQNRILEVKDVNTFNADHAISNGEALKILVKSLSYFYEYDISSEELTTQTYKNIDKKHPLYSVVEQAVRIGILKPNEEFHPDAKLTRELLAVWYVRALGLELAAKNYDIYKLDVADVDQIQSNYIGYVALANELQLLTLQNNQFMPKLEVSYANIATSIFPLAEAIHENR